MKVLLFKLPKDNDLKIGTPVCYKDLYGNFSRYGKIDSIRESRSTTTIFYGISTAIGSYTADELRLVEFSPEEIENRGLIPCLALR